MQRAMHNYLHAGSKKLALFALSHLDLFMVVWYTYTSIELGTSGERLSAQRSVKAFFLV